MLDFRFNNKESLRKKLCLEFMLAIKKSIRHIQRGLYV